jgi:hypothetical protein
LTSPQERLPHIAAARSPGSEPITFARCGFYPYSRLPSWSFAAVPTLTQGLPGGSRPPTNHPKEGDYVTLTARVPRNPFPTGPRTPGTPGRDPQQTPPGTPGRAPHKRNGRFPRQSPIAVISPRNHTSSYTKRTLLPTVTHRSTKLWYTGAANTYISCSTRMIILKGTTHLTCHSGRRKHHHVIKWRVQVPIHKNQCQRPESIA